MKLSGRTTIVVLLALVGLIAAADGCRREATGPEGKKGNETAKEPPQEEAMTVKEIRLPMAYHTNGVVKWQIRAAEAVMPPQGGDIKASKVTVEMFDEAGNPDGSMATDACVCNRSNETVMSESYVRVEKPGIIITGTGFEWYSGEQVVNIKSDVTVQLSGSMRNKQKGKGRW